MKKSDVVRREKDLMVHYISAHKRGDDKAKADIMKDYQRNVEQRRIAK